MFAQANPGYNLDGWRGKKEVFTIPDFYGQHGYDSSTPEMHAIFIAAGRSIGQTHQIIPPVKVIDYAPTIAKLLGFDPAPTADGKAIPIFLNK